MKEMTNSRRIALVIRWSLFATIMVALFWGIYWLVTGTMPTADKVQLTDGLAIVPPFAVPRIFDAQLIGVSMVALVFLLTSKTMREKDDISYQLTLSIGGALEVGVVLGIVVGLSYGPHTGVIFGSLVLGLFISIVVSTTTKIVIGLFIGLISELFMGIVLTLFGGSVFGLTFGLILALVCIVILAVFFAARLVGHFLMAYEK